MITLTLTLILSLIVLDCKYTYLRVSQNKADLERFMSRLWGFLKDWRVLLALIISIIITNGWSLVLLLIGKPWMILLVGIYYANAWFQPLPLVYAFVLKLLTSRKAKL